MTFDDWLYDPASGEPVDLVRGLIEVREGQPYFRGSAVPATGLTFDVRGQFALPTTAPVQSQPIDYMGVYLTLGDYMRLEEFGISEQQVAETIFARCRVHSRQSVVRSLAALAHHWSDGVQRQALIDMYRNVLGPVSAQRLSAALRARPDRRAFLARQPLLGAVRFALAECQSDHVPERDDNPLVDHLAIALTHAIASGLGPREYDHDLDSIADHPSELAIELTCNLAFNSVDDSLNLLYQTLRIWRDPCPEAQHYLDGDEPASLLQAATGMDIEEFISLAFAFWSKHLTFGPIVELVPLSMPPVEQERVDTLLGLISADCDSLALELASSNSDWDFLALQRSPVIRFEHGACIPDTPFFIQRFTNSLYWDVHHHQSIQGNKHRLRWTQAWGAMVERYVGTCIQLHAPTPLGGGRTFFTETDISAAYGTGRNADFTIDFGDRILVVEVVSGQLTVPTRVHGEMDSFEADMEKIVYKKLRQLNGTIDLLTESTVALTGFESEARVRPIVVAGGGFPLSPITTGLVTEYCSRESLFRQPLVDSPVIVDLGELEMLEGLKEHQGRSLPDVIDDWQASTLASVSLRNFILSNYRYGSRDERPSRTREDMDKFFEDVIDRLGLERTIGPGASDSDEPNATESR